MTIRTDNQIPTTDPRPLSFEDLTACLELSDNREWPLEDRKWEFLLRVGQGYGIVDTDGKLAASAVLTHFGSFAAISMVLVAAKYNRRGLGTKIMRHVMAEAGDSVATLYATPLGKPLYEKLGFQETSGCEVMTGTFTGRGAGTTRPAAAADLPAILRLDTEVCGADRTHVVSRLPDFADRIRVVERDGEITGYAAQTRSLSQNGSNQVGPVIAADDADARALIADIATDAGGQTRIDLDTARPDLIEWATQNGLKPVFHCSAMVVGGATLPGDRRRLYAPILQALG
ncbi:GNAT family N-acetyltransferase [Actinokineospora sp. HUAS TT18]|uniref:GNAT family N-acetyltransferase n=1 Tax=Actinokineospora sp. HUAS TT18 TaxID=3447451 RepID=UPI003F521875